MSSAYAKAGVDYSKIRGFKEKMKAVSRATWKLPNSRQVFLQELAHAHGVIWDYCGDQPHCWGMTLEGLGNKNWIAEWMYAFGDRRTHYDEVMICDVMMAANDVIAHGAMPVVYADEVAAGDSDWFAEETRATDLASGLQKACELVGMALGCGESPALRFLVNAAAPVTSAPSLSGVVIGIVAPKHRLITGNTLRPGDRILAVKSSGVHSNGISLVIDKVLALKDQFMTLLPNGRTLGEEVLTPTTSYVKLVETLLDNEVEIHSLLPGTGGGVAKLASEDRPLTYLVHSWFKETSPFFPFMEELGVSKYDCLRTFNCGGGYYVFVPDQEAERAIKLGTQAGYEIINIGVVQEGKRQTVFGPAGYMELPPPED